MYFIASANANSCTDMPGDSCRMFCYDHYGYAVIRPKNPGTACKMSGGKAGECENGECIKKLKRVKIQ
uniref:Putative salivary kunitz domain protein n=1 Tax=Ixodes ricinus TaxID=34613 RepID=A0A0K8R770_IXORI